jgi:hypothetical protein
LRIGGGRRNLSRERQQRRGKDFDLTEKFVLKLTFVTTSYRDKWDSSTFEKKLETVREYKTLIRPQGSENAMSCEINSATNTPVGEDDNLICKIDNFEFRFNLNSRRFLDVSFGNFLDKVFKKASRRTF